VKRRNGSKRAFPIEGIDAALRRAARKALELGERTGTPVWIMRNGQIVDLVKERAKRRSTRAKKR
jgi:hypothetical protein